MEIFQRIREWRVENEQLGLIPDFTDTWTPEQREAFMHNWQNDEPFIQVNEGDERFYEKINDESLIQQVGCGQKRSSEEMSEDDEFRDNFFAASGIKQVNVKKFKTTGTNYTIQCTNMFAPLELSEFHDSLHEIFQSVLSIELPKTFPHMIKSILYYIHLSLSIQYRYLFAASTSYHGTCVS
jgi:hypothetical protein